MKIHKNDDKRRINSFQHSKGLSWPLKGSPSNQKAYYFLALSAICVLVDGKEISRFDIDNVDIIHWDPDPMGNYCPESLPDAFWDIVNPVTDPWDSVKKGN